MNYNHEDLLADFASRTLHNLQLIRGIKHRQPQAQAYEVTQLINSMLGLLVFPKEKYLDEIPEKTLEELKAEGWPIPEVRSGYDQVPNLRKFLSMMRNAVAHFNIEFLPNGRNEIAGIRVWNRNNSGAKTWEADLSLEDLESLALRFIALLTGQNALIEWRRAFIRSGFNFHEINGAFHFTEENLRTEEFLRLILVKLGQIKSYQSRIFSPVSPTIEESLWLNAIERLHGGLEAGASFRNGVNLHIMDTYIAGIVRWVNAAGLKTVSSCDGEGTKTPTVELEERTQEPLLDEFLRSISDGQWRFADSYFSNDGRQPRRRPAPPSGFNRAWLLDVAEKLYHNQNELRAKVESSTAV